jgi:hypothetical protein
LKQRVFDDKSFQILAVLDQVCDTDSNVQKTVSQGDRFEIGKLAKAEREKKNVQFSKGSNTSNKVFIWEGKDVPGDDVTALVSHSARQEILGEDSLLDA